MGKVTILLGSGATIEIGAPSTKDITTEIVQPKKYTKYAAQSKSTQYFTTIENVYNKLKSTYPSEPNFEHIFHVLEMLSSYNWVWNHSCKNSNMFPVFAPFVAPQTEIIVHDELDFLSSLIKQCQLDIMTMINAYNEGYKTKKDTKFKWYKEFWNKFDGFNLFNLNYDTTIEESINDYCDGFVDSDDKGFKRFDPDFLYKASDELSRICHLHGCIVYYNQRYKDINHDVYKYNDHDMYKWNNFSEVCGMMKGSSGSNPGSQSGETLFIGPIITGLRKTDKLTVAPYDYYFHYLNTSILKNKSLLIVGYSFGDLYINDLIERMNLLYEKDKRIVIITHIDYYRNMEEDGTITKFFNGKEWEKTEFNLRQYLFIKKMLHDDSFELRLLDKTIEEESSYTSKDGDVKLFVYGFKSAIEKHVDEIVDFLEK